MTKLEKASTLSAAIGYAKAQIEDLELNRVIIHQQTMYLEAQIIIMERERDKLLLKKKGSG